VEVQVLSFALSKSLEQVAHGLRWGSVSASRYQRFATVSEFGQFKRAFGVTLTGRLDTAVQIADAGRSSLGRGVGHEFRQDHATLRGARVVAHCDSRSKLPLDNLTSCSKQVSDSGSVGSARVSSGQVMGTAERTTAVCVCVFQAWSAYLLCELSSMLRFTAPVHRAASPMRWSTEGGASVTPPVA